MLDTQPIKPTGLHNLTNPKGLAIDLARTADNNSPHITDTEEDPMRTLISTLIALAFTSNLQAQFGDFESVEIKTHPIRDNIFMLEGMGGNIGVSVGEDGVFIIDNQFTELYEKITAALASISDKPVDFVVNTHFHFDHSGGNMPFGMDGKQSIYTHYNPEESGKVFREILRKVMKFFLMTRTFIEINGSLA